MMRGLFNFEQDAHYALRRIPMIIRFKLDACGFKLPLAGWALLTREQRELLLVLPALTAEEQSAYRQQIIAMLSAHADHPDAAPEFVVVDHAPVWQHASAIPEQILEQLAELAVPVPTLSQWHSLDDLQRFTLVKLTRSGHKNINLLPALKEFGLA